MGRWKYEKVLLGCLLLIVLLAGCSVRSADELYALPRQSTAVRSWWISPAEPA